MTKPQPIPKSPDPRGGSFYLFDEKRGPVYEDDLTPEERRALGLPSKEPAPAPETLTAKETSDG